MVNRVSSARARFEATIQKNAAHGGSSSRSFLVNVASSPVRVSPMRRNVVRSRSFASVEDMEYEYNKIVNDEACHNHPMLTPNMYPKQTVRMAPHRSLSLDLDQSEPVESLDEIKQSLKLPFGDDESPSLPPPSNKPTSLRGSARLSIKKQAISALMSNPQDEGLTVSQVLEQVDAISVYDSDEEVEELGIIREEPEEDEEAAKWKREIDQFEARRCLPTIEEQIDFKNRRFRPRPKFVSPISIKERLRAFQRSSIKQSDHEVHV